MEEFANHHFSGIMVFSYCWHFLQSGISGNLALQAFWLCQL
jgi:hypothetical protein